MKAFIGVVIRIWQAFVRFPTIDHLIRSYKRFDDRMGEQFGAAITYFSFLSMIPILMVLFATAGYLLASHPDQLDRLRDAIVNAIANPTLSNSLQNIVNTAIEQRAVVGLTGLLVALYSGIRWMGYLREAIRAQMRTVWTKTEQDKDFILFRYAKDLLALLGLLFTLFFSIAMTSIAGSAQDWLVSFFHLDKFEELRPLVTGIALSISILSNYCMFLWLFWILPKQKSHPKALLLGTLWASMGFEAIKIAMTHLYPALVSSPSGAAFGSIIGLMFFFFIYARLILFCAAWIATYRLDN